MNVTLDESWTLLAEIDIEIGLAYLVYNADTLQDYSWQLKAAYEF
jgi:hypothetical protein